MKKLFLCLSILFVAAIVTACGSQATPEPLDVTIDMTEYKFTPNELELKVGQQVTITLVNKGTLDHEFMVGRNVQNNSDGNPDGYEVDLFQFSGVTPDVVSIGDSIQIMMGGKMLAGKMGEMEMDHMGYMVMVPVGNDTATISFTVTPEMVGTWEFGCFELDGVHYNSGMKGTLTITQ